MNIFEVFGVIFLLSSLFLTNIRYLHVTHYNFIWVYKLIAYLTYSILKIRIIDMFNFSANF